MGRVTSTGPRRAAAWLAAALIALGACEAPGEPATVPVGGGTMQVVEGAVPVNGGSRWYEEAGEGETVVLLHGGQLDRRMWDAQFPLFAKGYRTIRYDARGFGMSTPPAVQFTHHDDLLALMDHLHVGRAHLVGLSLGGRIAIDFALSHPERVASLTLAAPGLSGWRWSDADRNPPLEDAIAAGDRAHIVQAWLASAYMAPAMQHPDLAPVLRKLAADNAGSFLGPPLETEMRPPAIERLKELRMPVLLLVGSRDIRDIHGIVQKIVQQAANARLVTFDGVGHMVNMERPEAFMHEVLAFLATLKP